MKPLLCILGFIVGLTLAAATKPDLSSPAIVINLAGAIIAVSSLYRLSKCKMPTTKKE